jgi:hypothetical protein
MTMRTYYPPPEPEPRETPPPPRRAGAYDDTTPVRHGYTVADLSRIAGACIRSAARRGVRDLDDKRAAAMCALIEELHAHDCDPGGHTLIRAAERAIDLATDRFWANLGYNSATKELQKGFPRFWAAGAAPLLDERVAERVAVHQILAALPERQAATLRALAECDSDPKAAALLLGLTPAGVAGNRRNARENFLALWHEHETPPPIDWRKGRTNTYSEQAAAERPEIARRAVRVREQRRAETRAAA